MQSLNRQMKKLIAKWFRKSIGKLSLVLIENVYKNFEGNCELHQFSRASANLKILAFSCVMGWDFRL